MSSSEEEEAGAWTGSEDWDSEDVRLSGVAVWARWIRDDVLIQVVAWCVASLAVLGPESDWVLYRGVLPGASSSALAIQVFAGWVIGSAMTLGWATGRMQLVFTIEQKAMAFPPWSVLVFCKFRAPAIGSVIFFDGCDGRSYVRRVSCVRQESPSMIFVQTVGDLPGAPGDKPLYSLDGSTSWLDVRSVHGTMAAGPFSIKIIACLLICSMALSPAATLSFLATNQPFLTAWSLMVVQFAAFLLLSPLA